MADKLLRLRDVQERVPLSKAKLYRKMAQGEFPRPRQIGDRAVAWLEADISAWIAATLPARGLTRSLEAHAVV